MKVTQMLARRYFVFVLIPPFFLDCVFAIGLRITQPGSPAQTRWVATGFLYGDKVPETKDQYHVFLVTCGHVIDGLTEQVAGFAAQAKTASKIGQPIPSVAPLIRFNPAAGQNAQDEPIGLAESDWFRSKNADVAVGAINVEMLRGQSIRNLAFFSSDVTVANREKAIGIGLGEGDNIYVLGFPLGLVEEGKQNFAIVRSGVIARIRDHLAERKGSFLIDASVFPGNSGGPVVTRPELVSISGTKPASNAAYLIGMVRDFAPYVDLAVSQQTKRPRVQFEENSGLAEVIPIDDVIDTVKEASAPGQQK